MDLANTLTDQEMFAARHVTFDLGSGYPQLPVPQYVRDIYRSRTILERSLAMAPDCRPGETASVDRELEGAVNSFLGLSPARYATLRSTFSGATGIDRALTATIYHLVEGRRCENLHVVTTSPSIDIMPLLLRERRDLVVHFVESRLGAVGGLDREAITTKIATIQAEIGELGIIVLLTSPENPTGQIWNYEDLEIIARTCFDLNGVLIVDHSFLVAGVHDRATVPAVWDVLPPGSNWIALWDTGKTFGLNDDKLGFIVSGSAELSRWVQVTLSTLQFGVARRQQLFFAELLARASSVGHVAYLRNICRRNVDTALRLSHKAPIVIKRAPGGSLCFCELHGQDQTDEDVRQRLLRDGVGLVSGRVFFHTSWRPTNYIRLALARPSEYFEQGFARLIQHLIDGNALVSPRQPHR